MRLITPLTLFRDSRFVSPARGLKEIINLLSKWYGVYYPKEIIIKEGLLWYMELCVSEYSITTNVNNCFGQLLKELSKLKFWALHSLPS